MIDIDNFIISRDDIAPYKRPIPYELLSELPMNPSSKLMKQYLEAFAKTNSKTLIKMDYYRCS